MKKVILSGLLLISSFLLNSISSVNKINFKQSISNSSSNIGLFNQDNQKSDYRSLERLNWNHDELWQFMKDNQKNENYQDRFYVNWARGFVTSTSTPKTNLAQWSTLHPVRSNLPNTGSWLYGRNTYGIDILQNNFWNHLISSNDNNPYLTVNNTNTNQPSMTRDDNAFSNARSINNINSSLNFGLDYGSILNLNVNRNFQNGTVSLSMNSPDYLISNLLNLSNKNTSFFNVSNVVIPTNTQDPNQSNFYDQSFNSTYFNPKTDVPYFTGNVKIFPTSTTSRSISIGVFGVDINYDQNTYYLTFIVKKNNNDNTDTTSTKNDQQSLIIDQNSSKTTQQSEIDQIFSMYDVNESNALSNSQKINILQYINGNFSNASSINSWGIRSRIALSTLSKNNFGSIPNTSLLPDPTSSLDSNNRAFKQSSGYRPNDFINQSIFQKWNNGNINTASNLTNLFAFNTRFSLKRGFDRDLSTANPVLSDFFSPPFPISDNVNFYTNKFNFETNFSNNFWFLGNYLDHQQEYNYVSLNSHFPTSDENFFSIGSFNNNLNSNNSSLKPFYFPNNTFNGGLIASFVIMLVFVFGPSGYFLAKKYYSKRKKE